MPDFDGLSAGIGGFLNPKPSNDEVEIIINNGRVLGFTSNVIQRALNTIADGFNFSIAYDPEERGSDYFDPYSYYDCKMLINGIEFMSGMAIKWEPDDSNDGTTMTVTVRTKAGVLADCPPKDGKLSYKNQTPKEIAEKICEGFDLTVSFPDGDGNIIKKFNREKGKTAGVVLQELAKNNGFVMNSSRIKTAPAGLLNPILPDILKSETPDSSGTDADVIFEKANINGTPILNLIQGQQPIISCKASYDGTKRYSDFQVNSQTKSKPNNTVEIKDESIPVYRPIVISSNNIEQGGLQSSAEWKRARTLAESAPVTVDIDGWRDKNDNTVLENEIVTLYYPKACIFVETKFLIEKVNFNQGIDGKFATLVLVLPQAYTEKNYPAPDKFPWVRPALSAFDAFLNTLKTLGGIF